MKKYMAELITYRLPPLEERIHEYNKMNVKYKFHMDMPTARLSDYFLKMRNDICKQIGVEADDMCKISNSIATTDIANYQQKHVDSTRKTAITIPVSEFTDPLSFYAENGEPLWPRKYPKDHPLYKKYDAIPKAYTGYYSADHPTLTHVTILHNIPENTKNETRILFQLCFQLEFDEMISIKPDVWKFIPGQRYT